MPKSTWEAVYKDVNQLNLIDFMALTEQNGEKDSCSHPNRLLTRLSLVWL